MSEDRREWTKLDWHRHANRLEVLLAEVKRYVDNPTGFHFELLENKYHAVIAQLPDKPKEG